MEGGTVIKYTNSATLSVASSLVLQTTQFRPVTFTSMHDNSVGETIATSTGNPVRTTATYLSQTTGTMFDYKHLRFRYAGTAVVNSSCPLLTFWHSQFLNCGTCAQGWFMGGGSYVVFYNVLMSQCDRDASSPYSIVASGAHVTANSVMYLSGVVTNGGQYYYYTNSLARGVTYWTGTDPRNWMGGDVSDFVVKNSGDTSLFTAAGAGNFYLQAGSSYRNVGKTNLVAQLRADLKKTTTYPPLVFSNIVISVSTNLEPQAQRDTDGPDLGYHFDPLDHAFGGVRVTNATVRLMPGTAIASFGSSYGIGLLSGSRLICEGTPPNPNHIARFNLVQECSNTNWNGGSTSVKGDWLGGPTPAQASFRFTDWSMPAQDGYHFITCGYTMTNAFTDCQFHGGKLAFWDRAFTFTNSLLKRVNTSISDNSQMSPVIRNCLFYGGQLFVGREFSGTWTFRDNLFDGVAISQPGQSVDAAYNGFTTNTVNVLGGSSNKTNLVSGFQTGPLGRYYYPASGGSYSLTNLINSGSTWATNLGLYYFTTTTNQALEGSSKLDIGFHYLAVDANGNPIDTDGDGISDYWESLHGLNPQDAADGNDDPDGDDVSNYNEFLANSDPHEAWIVAWGASANFGQYNAPVGLKDVAMLDGGLDHTVALRSNGVVLAWGSNTYGQTNVPASLTDGVSIAASAYQNAALRGNGTVAQWGKYWYALAHYDVVAPVGLSNVTGIAVGKAHALALKNDGSLYGWGIAGAPLEVPANLAGVKAIAAGWEHSVALKSNGTVVAWGESGLHLTNVPAGLSNVTAITAGGYHTLALRSNGTVVAWGAGETIGGPVWEKGQSIVPAGLCNVVALAAGGYNSMALLSSGTVVGWGETNAPYGLDGVTAIGTGDGHCLALRTGRQTPLVFQCPQSQCANPGTTVQFSGAGIGRASVRYQWQFEEVDIAGATNTILTLVNVQTNSEGDYRLKVSNGAGDAYSPPATLALIRAPVVVSRALPVEQSFHYGATLDLWALAEAAGNCASQSYYSWYTNSIFAQTGTATNFTIASVKATNEGVYSLVATNIAGSATNVSWNVYVAGEGSPIWWGGGTQNWSHLQEVHDVAALAVGSAHYLAARDNGRVLAWGDNTSGQTNVPLNLSNVVAVAAGDAHSVALKADGTVVAWGSNTSGQTNVPPGLTNATAIAAGGRQSLALKKDGTVVQWGLTNAPIPPGLTNVTAIASGTNFNLALLQNSTVKGWGANDFGQTNLPPGLSNVVAIAAGAWHGLAVKSNGTVVAWGRNTSDQTNVPGTLSNVMAVAGGAAHSLALRNDGTVVAWGSNSAGQTNVPSWIGPVKLIAAGGNQSLVSMFSPLVQYPVDVTKDLLLIYNTNSLDSSNVCSYYLQHRPMVSGASVLGIGYSGIFVTLGGGTNNGGSNTFATITNTTVYESITYNGFTNQIVTPLQTWLNNNPSKRPQYVIFFLDLPSRIDDLATVGTNYPFYSDFGYASVSVQLSTHFVGWNPFVTHINMNGTNACIAYINKLASTGTNCALATPIISASARGYGNADYYFDYTGYLQILANVSGLNASNAVVQSGASPAAVEYIKATDIGLACHLTNGVNVAGYLSEGVHSSLGYNYATNGYVQWSGNSGWWIIETVESYNGQRYRIDQSNFVQWFAQNAFGGINYSNTPVGVTSHTKEPYVPGVNDAARYFGLWQSAKNFGICAWNSRLTPHFQAVGDPLVIR